MRPERLGRFGEDLVARLLGYRRQPLSGGKWPAKEDLIRVGELAQVKTTVSSNFLDQWVELDDHAVAEYRRARWFDVVITPVSAYVFERVLVAVEPLGSDAIGTRTNQRGEKSGRVKADHRLRRKVQDDHHEKRRRDVLT